MKYRQNHFQKYQNECTWNDEEKEELLIHLYLFMSRRFPSYLGSSKQNCIVEMDETEVILVVSILCPQFFLLVEHEDLVVLPEGICNSGVLTANQ